jgi:carbon monoxide dehydrogenase subunit G
MRLHEEFQVGEPVATVWRFFEQPRLVAGCMPGVEAIEIIDDDNVTVRVTQGIGPMTATFEARVTVLDRVPNELIRFQAIGRSVRGAAGHVRTMNEVQLRGDNESTTVIVAGDVVLAGALGSVGQKIVSRQAARATAEFAENLRRALTGEAPPAPGASGDGRRRPLAVTASAAELAPAGAAGAARPDPWSRVAAVLSAVSVALGLIALARSLRGRR